MSPRASKAVLQTYHFVPSIHCRPSLEHTFHKSGPQAARMDKFPTKDALVAGLSANLNATDNWDVVVSYSITELGDFLKTRWGGDEKNHVLANVSFTIDDVDRQGPFQQTFNLKLDAPKLSFTVSGSAEARLEMPISGTFQYVGLKPDGQPYPVETIPSGQYLCIASVPLKAVTAKKTEKDETVVVKTDASGKVIDFDEDPTAKVHIVFEFGAGASYKVEENPSKPAPKGAVNPFNPIVRAKLGGWMSELKYIQTLRYALAVVTKKTAAVAGAKSTLNPEKMTFVAYAPPKSDSPTTTTTTKGCLSVYMKVKDSGHNPGNPSPMFKLPVSNVATYPIADGFTASILIRNEVFANKFLIPTIAASSSISKVTSRATTKGFGLDIKLNSKITAPVMSKETGGTWGHYTFKVRDTKWDLGDANVAFDVDASGKASWKYTLEGQIEWTQYDNGPQGSFSDDLDGHVVFELDKKDQVLFEKISDEELAAKLKLNKNWWEIKGSDKDNNHNPFSGHNKPPGDWVKDGLKKANWPSFDISLALDYFSVSNVFAPGSKMIHPTGISDVFTPHDVLILGKVIVSDDKSKTTASIATTHALESAGASMLVTESIPDMSSLLEAIPSAQEVAVTSTLGIDDSPNASSVPPIKLPKTKSTADLMSDIEKGGPIVESLVKALRDPKDPEEASEEALENSEYTIVSSELPDIRKEYNAGPDFRVSRVSGVYKFTEPQQLTQQTLTIYNNKNMYLNQETTATPYTVDKDGILTFESAGKSFAIGFHTEFNDGGLPKEKSFEGKARPAADASDPGVVVKGVEDHSKSIWDASLTRESFVGLLMSLAIPFISAYVAHRENRQGQQDEQQRQDNIEAIRNVIEPLERAPTIEEKITDGVNEVEITPEDLRHVTAEELEKDGHISDIMYEAMRRKREEDPTASKETLQETAKEAARNYLEGRSRSIIRTKVYAHLAQQQYGNVVDVLRNRIVNAFGPNEGLTKIVNDKIEEHVQTAVEADMALLEPGNDFFDAVVDADAAEAELDHKDRALDGELTEIEKRLKEAERDVKTAQKAELDYQQRIAESPNRALIEAMESTKKDLKDLREAVEKAEKARDKELKERKDRKEAIDHLEDKERTEKKKDAEDRKKAAEHNRGSLAR
ncbi:hypothetical protein B0T16DRAFT_107803 [Cercophora newfieldiana]|uniref:Uncharacterized protein n=1 Tax=Cercophora newfieldiana TaxID=92897 RepID=A0AA40CVC8_9PEZI|nr:hypothetical protein B0T16DRAFT_107803 [Cercophora newfieldiana]